MAFPELKTWLEEAKESLSTAGPICNEANSLLSIARTKLENASVLWSQTKYLFESIKHQLKTLKTIRDELVQKQTRKNQQFEVCI